MSAEIVSINTKVPPKSVRIRHRGLHGTVTYNPDTKKWDWKVTMLVKMPQTGTETTQAKAEESLRKILETAATSGGNNVTTTD